MSAVSYDRLQELLATRATQGLDGAGHHELKQILLVHPEWDDEGFDLAAAALDLALQHEAPDIPRALKQRLESMARTWRSPPAR